MLLSMDNSIYRTQFTNDELREILKVFEGKMQDFTYRATNNGNNARIEAVYISSAAAKLKNQIEKKDPNRPKKKTQTFMNGKIIEMEES